MKRQNFDKGLAKLDEFEAIVEAMIMLSMGSPSA